MCFPWVVSTNHHIINTRSSTVFKFSMMLLSFKMRRGKWLINLGDSEALLKANLKPLNREEVESLIH
jgi:hypothetical protein